MNNKKIIVSLIISILFIILIPNFANASQYLNNLNFYAEIDSNGNINVVETWNITVSSTNTLYKTFRLDSTKYSGITNVLVQEVGKGNLNKYDKWAYHLPTGYYYGGLNEDGEFEICWGTGLENSSATKTYKISYTFLDAVSKYNDCAEVYWQLIGSRFGISAKSITGTIKLPENTYSKEDIRVWGHVETLNGEIYSTSNNTIEFTINDYTRKNYVEVRIALPTDLVAKAKRTYNLNKLDNIIAEETSWAEEANNRRLAKEKSERIAGIIAVIAILAVLVFLFIQFIKYIKILKNTKKLQSEQKLDYYREKPEAGSTPGDALYLYYDGIGITTPVFGNLFSATMLNLKLKGYFDLVVNKNEKGKDEVIISRTNKDIDNLQYEEEKIAKFISNAMGANNSITLRELQKYIKKHGEKVMTLKEKTANVVKEKQIELEKYDEKTSKQKTKYISVASVYLIIAVILFAVLPLSIPLIINGILAIAINRRLSRLTQKGIDEKEKWKGLKKYMEDFSLLNEKEVPAIEVWEEYMVYATVFGIADKVIKQLKLVYPDIENMSNLNTASYVYLMSHTDFNSSFSHAISSSITSTMSSGSGGGGGFSGGGGGGFRWWPVAEDAKQSNQINRKE